MWPQALGLVATGVRHGLACRGASPGNPETPLLPPCVQASGLVATGVKYALATIDARTEGRWEAKGVYVFYLELLTDMLHLLVYLAFFIIVFTHYGLPLHLVRARGGRSCAQCRR